MNESVTASNVETKSVTQTYSWTLTAYENHGKLWLKWTTDAPFRAQQDKIEVYANEWPSNPDSKAKSWTWADMKNSPWDSGLDWGSNWHCARIAQSAPNGAYVYVERFIL